MPGIAPGLRQTNRLVPLLGGHGSPRNRAMSEPAGSAGAPRESRRTSGPALSILFTWLGGMQSLASPEGRTTRPERAGSAATPPRGGHLLADLRGPLDPPSSDGAGHSPRRSSGQAPRSAALPGGRGVEHRRRPSAPRTHALSHPAGGFCRGEHPTTARSRPALAGAPDLHSAAGAGPPPRRPSDHATRLTAPPPGLPQTMPPPLGAPCACALASRKGRLSEGGTSGFLGGPPCGYHGLSGSNRPKDCLRGHTLGRSRVHDRAHPFPSRVTHMMNSLAVHL